MFNKIAVILLAFFLLSCETNGGSQVGQGCAERAHGEYDNCWSPGHVVPTLRGNYCVCPGSEFYPKENKAWPAFPNYPSPATSASSAP